MNSLLVGATCALIALTACLAAGLIVIFRPLLVRYALARPSARGLHTIPTPQGGGIAVMLAMAAMLAAVSSLGLLEAADVRMIATVMAAMLALALVGAVDDIRPIPSLPRLVLHLVLASGALLALPDDMQLLGNFLPAAAERAILVVALAWFANLSNFMDGMDWMSVTEMAPLCAALLLCAAAGLLPAAAVLLLGTLLGGLIGFAPFNRPVARLFLGDVGSLPIGLCVGFCLMLLAGNGQLAAALLLPLYYIADSGITLARRAARGERLWEAHRTHFYQIAIGRGMSVRAALMRVACLNLVLAALAFASILSASVFVQAACLALGGAAVAVVLRNFAKGANPLLP